MLHLTPRALGWQVVVAASLLADPVPTRRDDGVDHFGNPVTWMALDQAHARFRLSLEAVVEVMHPAPPAAEATWGWERVAAAVSFPAGRPVLAGLLELMGRIRREFAFKPGVTTISTPVARVLAQRAGVCQDFTHLMIAGLRALGLPARYVSGYLRTRPPPGQAARQGADQSHAWVGAWLGPEHGWVDSDPTITWWCVMSMWCWRGGGITAISARCAGLFSAAGAMR